jgi:hypothetical protein
METSITHFITTISHDYFTITHFPARGEFHIENTLEIDPDVQVIGLDAFRKVFSNDPKVLALFEV